MNELAATRVQGWRCHYTGIKGDWKYQAAALCVKTNWAGARVCELCLASSCDEFFLFTDCGEDANWRHAQCTPPADVQPGIAVVSGFSWHSSFCDILHCVWRGP
jgi:hypothetical protein